MGRKMELTAASAAEVRDRYRAGPAGRREEDGRNDMTTTNLKLTEEEAYLLLQALRKMPATLSNVALLGRVDDAHEWLRRKSVARYQAEAVAGLRTKRTVW